MRFEYEGMALWYGLPDTPSPEGAVHVGTDITVTIAVKPADASNKVELLYRRDQGPVETVTARWLRHDLSNNAQYFKARFPAFRVGDTVEYTAVCYCAGRQVPSHSEAQELASSFQVVASEVKPIASRTTKETSIPEGVMQPVNIASQQEPSSGELLPYPPPAMPQADGTTKMDAGTAALSATEPTDRLDSTSGASPAAPGSFFALRSLAAQPAPDGPGASVGADASIYTVVGTVASPDHTGVGGLRIQVVDKNVGQDVPLAEGVTDARGGYRIQFSSAALRQRGKENPDLQARVFAGETFLAASNVRYNATNLETLNVKLPAHSAILRSEYETLTGALGAHYNGRLGDLKESADRQDITYLANKTSWDARAVALAALADQFSQHRTDGAGAAGIQPAFYYALFRAGLPANPDTLYAADAQTVSRIWQQAIEQGVIPQALEHELPGAVQAFQRLSAAHALDARAVAGTSSLKEMLHLTLGDDAQRQQQFADLYARYHGDLPTFWRAAQQSFGEQTTKRLQLDGQLGFLTLNNAPLIARLHDAERQSPLTSMLDLAQRGYYQPAKWVKLLDGTIPEQIPGSNLDEQRANYAEMLAAQVRLSFPTTVVTQLVGGGEIPLAPDVQDGVYAFLTENQGAFEIGMEPIERYLARTNLTDSVAMPVVEQIKRLQRVYQITPTDQAFTVLLQHNLDSAYAITRYDGAAFVRSFKDEMGGEAIASLTYAKAQQVYNAVLNIASTYLTARRAPALGSNTNALIINSAPLGPQQGAAPIVAYPTLEELLGSMDYCTCDQCRSILSPAAYLVDLLQFIDCKSPQNQNPQAVLFSRRPDIQYLPLTCENTNTALPYIDLVNETLEYFVANSLTLTNYSGHNTDGTIPSDELLANPQCVNDAAYTTLQNALFPPPLPFHRPLELLRLYFQKFGIKLQDAMAVLRPSDAIERGTAAYGWRDILMEQLGLSRIEYQLLTDSTLTLQHLYGYPTLSDNAVINVLSSIQDFSRRVSVSYDDLVSILKTRFINPSSALIPLLEHLDVPFTTLQALKTGAMPPSDFKNLLPAGLDAREYGGTTVNDLDAVVKWVTDPTNYGRIMGLITIANPTGSTDLCSMKALQFRYANPDTNANTLHAIDFVHLLRFIRLWRKLGLTIEQTDDVVATLYPAVDLPTGSNDATDLQLLDAGFKTLLPRIGFAFQVMNLLQLTAERDLLSLLACWAPIGTVGDHALYRTMFLTPTLLQQNPAFAPDTDGNVLQDTTQAIFATPVSQKALVGGTMTVNDVLTTTINGVSIVYTVGASDTSPVILAGNVAAAVNATATVDPITGLPLNQVISATNAAGVVMFNAVGSGGAFTLACSVSPGATETYVSLDHAPALRAAFNLTASELALISQALGFDEKTILNLENISAIYRYGWLARKLGLSIVEFLLLKQFTGLDPFTAPDPARTPPAKPSMLRLIRLVQALHAASLKPVQALYLIWNQDISGKSVPSDREITGLARTLRANFAAVESQFALVDDPNGDIAKALMALVYGTDATDFFFGLLNNTLSVAVPYDNPQPTLPQPVLDAASGRLSYDDLRKQLTYTGVLDANTLAALDSAIGANGPLKAAVDKLAAANHNAVDPFFATYPELLPLYTSYVASNDPPQTKRTALLQQFLPDLKQRRKQEQALAAVTAAVGIDSSFAPVLLDDATVLHSAADNKLAIINDVTTVEAQGLSAQFFLTNNLAIAPDTTVDAVPALSYSTGGSNPLPAGISGSPIAGIWSGYLDAPQNGFYNISVVTDPGATVTLNIGGADVGMALEPNSTTMWRNQNSISLTAGALSPIVLTVTTLTQTLSVSWKGQSPGLGMQVIPSTSLYSATLIDHLRAAYVRFLKGTSLATALSLTANEVAYLASNGDFQVNGQGWLNTLAVSGSPDTPTAIGLRDVLSAVLDFARIKAALSPSDERLLAVLENPQAMLPSDKSALLTITRWDQGSLNALLTQFFTGTQVSSLAHLENFRRVYDAYALVTACGISAAALIAATTNNPTAHIVSTFQSALRARYGEADWLAVIKPINDTMRGRQRDALVAYVLQQLGDSYAQSLIHQTTSADTSTGATLLSCSDTTGVSPGMLVQGTNIAPGTVVTATTSATITISTGILAALPAGSNLVFVPENAVEINTPDKLFEYFLMDVEMDPCMQTSRIRHALSSVQLFIERCLRNLEPDVSPSDIQAAQWEWMKRYRVWEANRKVFLWPENWLDPELRDDQSQFFKETMSELLQSDITEDTAAVALLHYLSKLEEVAKLEPCGMYYVEPSSPGTADDIVHVVARTAGAHRKYYYRRREGGFWTPWEQIKLDIEDNPVIPVVWKGRLLLFWLRILKQTPIDPQSMQISSDDQTKLGEASLQKIQQDAKANAQNNTLVTMQAVLCWSEYYNGKWQPTKTSDINRPTGLGSFSLTGPGAFDRAGLLFAISGEGDAFEKDALLRVSIFGAKPSSFLLYNTHSLLVRGEDAPKPPDHPEQLQSQLRSRYNQWSPYLIFTYGNSSDTTLLWRTVLGEKDQIPLTTIEPPHPGQNLWDAPFFVQDSRHVFYVTTTEQQVPISDNPSYGVAVNPSFKQAMKVSPLILQNDPRVQVGPKLWSNGVLVGSDPGVIDPAPMRRFVTEDANIHQGIGTTIGVMYGDRQIEPSSSISTARTEM